MPELEISRIHDAYAEGGECPICSVMTVAEDTYVRSFHGARVMAPEVRVRTNLSGFCPTHYERLYRGEGKLGLGLMVHTHLAEIVPRLRRELEGARAQAASVPTRGVRGLLGLRSHGGEAERLVASLEELVSRCLICEMLAKDLDRYCFTVSYLWQRDPTFLETLRRSRGFCLAHYAALLRASQRMLGPEDLARFLGDTAPLMQGSLERLEEELLAFTRGYRHDARAIPRSEEERTALSRAVQKLSGRLLRLEKGLDLGPAEDQEQDRLAQRCGRPRGEDSGEA